MRRALRAAQRFLSQSVLTDASPSVPAQSDSAEAKDGAVQLGLFGRSPTERRPLGARFKFRR